MAGHSYAPWTIDSLGERVLANLITGGAILFVFISGFFFHHVFADAFNLKAFLLKKFSKVVLPYLILSAAAILGYVMSSSPLPFAETLGVTGALSPGATVEMVAIYLWTGRIASAYWYIPFITIIFVMSPLFLRYVRLGAAYRVCIMLVLVVLSMYVHRSILDLSPLHEVVYFVPAYLLGINCSIHRVAVHEHVGGRSVVLGAGVVGLAVLQALLIDGHGNLHKDSLWSYDGMDIMILQKLVMCFFFVSVLQKIEHRHIGWLKTLAAWSFAIYFIHPWVLKLIEGTGVPAWSGFVPGFGVFVLTVPLVVASSLLITYLVKGVLKDGSRYVVGA